MGKGKGVNVFSMWVQNIYRYTNMPMSCPIQEVSCVCHIKYQFANYSYWQGQYYWRNLRPDRDSIPAFIMTGHFRIDALFYMKDWRNDMLTNTSMFVDIKMK